MASVVAGGLFNAVAFAGAGYVFHKLDKKGYEDEMKRYNLADFKLLKKNGTKKPLKKRIRLPYYGNV